MRSNGRTSVPIVWVGALSMVLAAGSAWAEATVPAESDPVGEDRPCWREGPLVICDAWAFRLLEDEFEEVRAELALARLHLEDAAADAEARMAFERAGCQEESGGRWACGSTQSESWWARTAPRVAVGLSIVGTATAATGLGIAAHDGASVVSGWMMVGGLVFDLIALSIVY